VLLLLLLLFLMMTMMIMTYSVVCNVAVLFFIILAIIPPQRENKHGCCVPPSGVAAVQFCMMLLRSPLLHTPVSLSSFIFPIPACMLQQGPTVLNVILISRFCFNLPLQSRAACRRFSNINKSPCPEHLLLSRICAVHLPPSSPRHAPAQPMPRSGGLLPAVGGGRRRQEHLRNSTS
jgi:hypothetical protein